jgi:hypothetical protein
MTTYLAIAYVRYTTVPISDSIWLAGGSLAIGAGNQIYLFSRFLDRYALLPSPAASAKSVAFDLHEAEDIFQLIAWQNGPLWDYHPTVLAQCLLWDKIDLVKRILVDLARRLQEAEEQGKQRLMMSRLDPSDFFLCKQVIKLKDPGVCFAFRRFNSFSTDDSLLGSMMDCLIWHRQVRPMSTCSVRTAEIWLIPSDDEDDFSPRLVSGLAKALNGKVSVALSASEKSQLATLASATFEVSWRDYS